MFKKILCLLILIFACNSLLFAGEKTFFYGHLKSNEVNLRSGPNKDFPLLITYKMKNMPIHVIDKYDNWYKVIDKDGDKGWVIANLISDRSKTVITLQDQLLFSNHNKEAYPIYRVEKNVVFKLHKCKKTRCKVSKQDITGWLNKETIWGY